jgi:hypothetical protein
LRRAVGKKFLTIVAAWRRAWTRVIPFFAFPRSTAADLHDRRAAKRARATPKNHRRKDLLSPISYLLSPYLPPIIVIR